MYICIFIKKKKKIEQIEGFYSLSDRFLNYVRLCLLNFVNAFYLQ